MTDDDPVTDYNVIPGRFPAELLASDRWFVWALDEDRKIPRAPWANPDHHDRYVSWKDPENWTTFDEADDWAQKVDRYGHASCIPAYDDNSVERLIFFDFDNCRDPETGAIHPHAWAFIQGQHLSAFLSTSGTGLHGFGWGSLPEGYKPSFEHDLDDWDYADAAGGEPYMEVYASARFVALTGQHIDGTPLSVPDLGDDAHRLFERFGNERTTGIEREPSISRDELADVETTTDVEDIYDAIAHTRPSDIRLRSPVTEEYTGRDANCARDPSWASSESGTRLAEFDDHWLYRKGNHRLDALQVVALEERIIRSEDEYPSGQDFVDAVDALRERGAHIPQLVTTSASTVPPSSEDAADARATDGGVAAETPPSDSESADTTPGPSEMDDIDDWADIRRMFREAEDSDDRAVPRFESAMKLHREYTFANLEENDHLYVYEDDTGIYNDTGEKTVRSILTQALEEQYRSHTKTEVLDHIRGRNTLSQDEMGGPEGLIAAQNCVIDLHDGEMRDHSPQYRFLSQLGCEFDPDATAPRFEAFLEEVVPSEIERQKLQEFVGYTLHHWDHPYHKALFLVGPTASGKSTFLDTVNAMLGEGTVASLTPQQMTSERFSGAELFGKWANIRNDIPAGTVENTGLFKEIVAADPMKAERKRKDPFMFKPKAKHLFAANQLPETDTDDEAFYRRILLAPFPETIPVSERDTQLDEKLQDELPGVLNWAVEGLQRLLANGGFTGDRTPGQTRETWKKWGDSIKRFRNVAITDGDEDIPKSMVYAAYIEYCRQESIPSDTQHTMTRVLKQEGLSDGRAYVDGEQQRCFVAVSWTGRGKELLEAARSGGGSTEAESRRRTGLTNFD